MKSFFFSHDSDALSDNKIAELRTLYGMEGYGVYWAVLEMLSREDELALEYTGRKLRTLTLVIQPSFDIKKFINDCVDIGLFQRDDKYFWSESLRKRLSYAGDMSDKRRAAAQVRWKGERANANAMQVQCKTDANAMQVQCKTDANALPNESGLHEVCMGNKNKNKNKNNTPASAGEDTVPDSKAGEEQPDANGDVRWFG